MKRQLLATSFAVLALPASAAASSGVVLSVDSQHHMLQVVDSRHAVGAYHYRGKLPKVHLGSLISFSQAGHTISHVKARRGSHRVSFVAHVLRTSKQGVVLRLADGKVVKFSAKALARGHRGRRHHGLRTASGSGPHVTLNVQGLQPGETVMVTESVDSSGNVTITITLPPHGGGGGQPGDQDVTGTITQISPSALTVKTPDHGTLTFVVDSSDITDGYLVGDEVDVTYSQLSGGTLDAADVEYVENDATGTVSSVSAGSLSLVQDGTGQTVSFTANPADGIFDGVLSAQHVDVTYHQAAAGLVADAVDNGSGG